MAKVDLTNFSKNNQKKNVSLATAKLQPTLMTPQYGAALGTLANGDVVTLFTLPPQCVITDCYLVVQQVPTGTGQQATIQVKADSVPIMNAVAVGATAQPVGQLTNKTWIPAGAVITATIGAQNLTDGVVEVVVQFAEISRTNGEYLN